MGRVLKVHSVGTRVILTIWIIIIRGDGMFLKKEHIEVLRALVEGSDVQKEGGARSRRLLELRIQGLVDGGVTEAGKLIVDAFSGLELNKLEDPLLDSSTIKMIELWITTGEIPARWKDVLERRGVDKKRGELILQAYARAKPSIFITPYIAEFVTGMPPGPGMLSDLTLYAKTAGYGENVIHALEAMRWIKISPETKGKAYTLTPLGRKIRNILRRYPVGPMNILFNARVLRLLTQARSVAEEQELILMGLVSGGEATPLAKELEKAFNMTEILPRVAPTYVSVEEVAALKALLEAEKKENVLATEEWVQRITKNARAREILLILESKGWVRRKEVKGKDTWEATEQGRTLVEFFGNIIMDIPSEAVKAITFSLAGDVPMPEWVQEARRHGLVAGDITKKGMVLYELARDMQRLPILTWYDAAILVKTPRERPITLERLVKEVSEYIRVDKLDIRHPRIPLERSVRIAISEAESRGYVVILQNGVVKLTRIGDLMKSVIEYGKTREMVRTRFGVTPVTYHITRTLIEHANELRKLWRELDEQVRGEAIKLLYNRLKKYTSVTVEEIWKQLRIMKMLGLVGDMGPTKAAEYLVSVGEALSSLTHSTDERGPRT